MSIETKEYQQRQDEICKILADKNLKGVIVVSRGGFTYDRHYNVFYLTGHYQPYVYLPGNLPHWSGRAHTVLVMSAGGETILCVSTPDCEKKGICAEKITYSGDFNKTLADAMDELNLSSGDIGLIGSDVLPTCHWRYIVDKFPGINWVEVEAELDRMKRIKSEAEKASIRSACALNRKAIDAFYQALKPGITEADAVAAAYSVAAAEGAGIPFCAVSSGDLVHAYTSKAQPGFSKRILCEGDMVKIDLGIVVDGYLSEFGRTYVLGDASEEQRKLLDTVHTALGTVIDFIKPGVSAQEIVACGDSVLGSLGVATAGKGGPGQITGSYPVLWGHGLGLGFERPWLISGEELTIEEGMFLAVEKFLSLENIGTAAAEQNLLVGADGAEILTDSEEGAWL
ncbi:MAG: M24 family metallopeptidase [Desulfobacterales bacterium]